MNEAILHIERRGALRLVTLNRPSLANAVNLELHEALVGIWDDLRADEGARAVVLTGAGDVFCGGGDLDWIRTYEHDHAARDHSLVLAEQLVTAVLSFPLPIVAAVNGPAVGLGCSLALLCDVVLLSERATMSDPHVMLGLAAGDGGAAFWPLLTPLLRTRRYLLTGEAMDPQFCVEVGLASEVLAPSVLLDEALRLAERLARRPPGALAATKSLLNRHLQRAIEDGTFAAGISAERTTMQDPDHLARLDKLSRRSNS